MGKDLNVLTFFIALSNNNKLEVDNYLNDIVELKQMLEEAAKLGAQKAIEQLSGRMMYLENPNADVEDVSNDEVFDMERVKKRITVNGETKWFTGTSEREVKRKIDNYIKETLDKALEEKTKKNETPKFANYANEWWIRFKEPRLKKGTALMYKIDLENHILPYFSEMEIGEIKTSDVQDFIRTKNNYAKSTVRQIVVILRQIFDSAMEDEIIEKNPAASKRITLPIKEEKRTGLSREEITDIISNLDKLSNEDSLYMMFLIYTGMRRGEIIGVRWEDIDWNLKIINVNRSITFRSDPDKPGETNVLIGTPKSNAGLRQVPIAEPLLEKLTEVKKESGYIFNRNGKPITETCVRRQWERIGKKIDLHDATPHRFRHSFATMAVASGIDIKTTQTILGHSDVKTTLKVYAEATTDNILNAGTKVKAFYPQV